MTIIIIIIHREASASIYDLIGHPGEEWGETISTFIGITITFIIISIIITITITREVTASIYDLMGHPGGERERSEAAEQQITRRADLLFQVTNEAKIICQA